MSERIQVAIPVFPQFTALDAVGPYEVLQRIPSIDVTFVGHRRGEFRSENGMLGLVADATFEQVPVPDVIVFPGGVGTRVLQGDEQVVEWVRAAHAASRFTTSVCTGSLVLGAAGLLSMTPSHHMTAARWPRPMMSSWLASANIANTVSSRYSAGLFHWR
jgi:putative intracellular protease/amidase